MQWRFAAAWAQYTWEQFQALDGADQSAVVAAYECHQQIRAILDHEQARAIAAAAKQ